VIQQTGQFNLSGAAAGIGPHDERVVAVRAFPVAHTNHIFVLADGRPIRASRLSAEWCLRGWTSSGR
jgi:hypothetical protein